MKQVEFNIRPHESINVAEIVTRDGGIALEAMSHIILITTFFPKAVYLVHLDSSDGGKYHTPLLQQMDVPQGITRARRRLATPMNTFRDLMGHVSNCKNCSVWLLDAHELGPFLKDFFDERECS